MTKLQSCLQINGSPEDVKALLYTCLVWAWGVELCAMV